MGIIRATAYPSRYADEDWLEEEVQPEALSVGKFYLRFDALKAGAKRYIGATYRQRAMAELVGRAIHEKDCMDGKVDVVMTKSISRFARNLADCVNCVRQLKEKGIPVLFEKEGLSSMDAGCELILSVLATMAQEEVNNLSQNIRWSLSHRNASGNPSRAARYGYRKEPDEKGKKVWRIYEPEAKRVRLAFQMALQEQNYSEIVMALNDMEIEEGTDVRWTRQRVFEMLKSEVYIGDILTNKGFKPDFLSKRVVKNTGQRTQYYLEGHHEPIIDRETFKRVGELINQKKLRVKKTGRSTNK